MKVAAIIASAGIGKRMGGACPKQYLEVAGRPIICRTLDRFLESGIVDDLIAVVEPERIEAFRADILKKYGYPAGWKVTSGGDVRQRSVANGLALVSKDCDVVVVHDGVRPFVGVEDIRRSAMVAFDTGACIVAAPIKDTIKRLGANGMVSETVDRSVFWGAKTPQAFRLSVINEAMKKAFDDNFIGTDEASLVERLGLQVAIVAGNDMNIKITTPEDMLIAEAILASKASKASKVL